MVVEVALGVLGQVDQRPYLPLGHMAGCEVVADVDERGG